jgi:hypothetical protein
LRALAVPAWIEAAQERRSAWQRSVVHVRRALQERFELVPAFSMLQAVVALEEGDIDAILCSVHFDDSRMFDLLELVRASAPGIPCICCRILRSGLDPTVLTGAAGASRELGCLEFIDYNNLQRQHGLVEADRRFLDALLRLLPAREAESSPSEARGG